MHFCFIPQHNMKWPFPFCRWDVRINLISSIQVNRETFVAKKGCFHLFSFSPQRFLFISPPQPSGSSPSFLCACPPVFNYFPCLSITDFLFTLPPASVSLLLVAVVLVLPLPVSALPFALLSLLHYSIWLSSCPSPLCLLPHLSFLLFCSPRPTPTASIAGLKLAALPVSFHNTLWPSNGVLSKGGIQKLCAAIVTQGILDGLISHLVNGDCRLGHSISRKKARDCSSTMLKRIVLGVPV